MKPKVWTEVKLHPDAMKRLVEVADVAEDAPASKREKLPGVEIAIIGSAKVDNEFFDQAGPQLKMAIRHGIGYDKLNVAQASARGILTANTPNGPTEGTAEHAVGLIFAVTKNICRSDRALHAHGVWEKSKFRGSELLGKTLGLVGFGRVGQRVAEMCGLGVRMEIIFYDPFLPANAKVPPYATRIEKLDDLLKRADVVSLHLGASPQTYRMIGEAQLRMMKPDAFIVNTSRGEIIDEKALISVLQSGHLRGAGIDVFDPEPASPDNPLFKMDNVVTTPHDASATIQASFKSSSGVVDQIIQLIKGEKPVSLIDPAAWPGRMADRVAKSA